jgi:hypothetical protein
VVIGGSNANWLKQNSSGTASIGSFTDSAPNSVFVFDLAAWARAGVTDGDGRVLNAAAAIATTASHEAGHAFGLRHQAIYNSYGTKISNYNPGTADWTPIMGNNLCSDRTTWTYGPTDLGAGNLQSELDVLRDKLGYVTDDHGNLTSYASPLQTNPKGSFAGNGVIHYLGDVDSFKFTVSAGYVQINVSGAQYGPNLIPMVELWSSGGLIARAGGGSATQSVVGFDVKGGTYYVMVRPDGGYGSLGQYSVLVSVAPLRTTSIVSGLNTTSSMDSLLLVNSTSGLNDTQLLQTTALSTATTSSSTGAGQGADSLDVQATRSVMPAMASNTKSESRRPKFELHDEVFGLDEFDKEVAAWLS